MKKYGYTHWLLALSFVLAPLTTSCKKEKSCCPTATKEVAPAVKKDILVNAGILPYWKDNNGTVYFLLGQERSRSWADFGGNFEDEDASNIITAAREFAEETKYVFGKYADGLENLEEETEGETHLWKSVEYITPRIKLELTHPEGYYKMYLAEVDFIPADVFNNAFKVPHYEKRDYAWVPVKQFMQAVQNTTNRRKAYYQDKLIRRQIYDVFNAHHDLIMSTLYPGSKSTQRKKRMKSK